MASIRPVSRLLSHCTKPTAQIPSYTLRLASRQFYPILQTQPRHNNIHTTRSLFKQDSEKLRVPPKDPETNDAYADGAPGEPKAGESLPSGISPSTIYTFGDIQSISASPDSYPNRILVDVREQGELLDTGRIPGARNIPIGTAPDSFFMSAEDFEDKYGFARPSDQDEVIFYCKAGVRSKAAARLAGQAGFGGKQGEFPGSWKEWEAKGGEVQKE